MTKKMIQKQEANWNTWKSKLEEKIHNAEKEDAVVKLRELIRFQSAATNRTMRVARMFPIMELLLTNGGAAIIREHSTFHRVLRIKISEFFETGVPVDLGLLMAKVYQKYYV
jgi:hypothetical protein